MRSLMRILPALVLLAAGSFTAFPASLDFGGSVTNMTAVAGTAGSAPGLVQEDLANLWVQAALGSSYLLSGQLNFTYTNVPLLVALDAGSLSLQGTFPLPQPGVSLYRYSIGRSPFTDFTGLVLDQNADGLSMTVEFPIASVSVGAAYTGLLLKPSSTIILSRADANDAANPAVIFAPPRLLQTAQLTFPSVLRQRITLAAIVQEDMRDTVLDLATPGTTDLVQVGATTQDPTRAGPVNTQYFGLGMDGGITSDIFYNLYGYMETGQELQYTAGAYAQVPILAYLAGGGVRWYMPNLLFSVASAKFTLASGDQNATTVIDGNTTGFRPITNPTTVNDVFTPQLTNVMIAEAGYSLKPLAGLGSGLAEFLQAQARTAVFLRPTAGPISLPGISAGNTDLYLGTEVDLILTSRPFSDLGLTFTTGLFVPGGAFGSSAPLQYRAELDAALSF